MPTSVPIYDVENNGSNDPIFKSILKDNLRTETFNLMD